MKYTIDKSSKDPAYIQLYSFLKEDIVNLIYPYQTKLPSKRILAEETGVSVITIEHTYNLLEEEGYIETKQRSGYYVSFKRNAGFVTSSPKKDTDSLLPLQANSQRKYDFPISVLTKAIRRVLIHEKLLFIKSEGQGLLLLRKEIANYLERSRGFQVEPSQIIIGSGSEYLYGILIRLLGEDRTYAIENPSYKRIEEIYASYQVKIEKLTLQKDGISSSELKETRASILHVTPFRSFPSGVTASPEKRLEYLDFASKRDHYVIEDDFESEFSILRNQNNTLFSQKNDHVIYLNTFSQTISSSLRIAYLILPKDLLKLYQEKMGHFSSTVSTFDQLLIYELLQSGDFEKHINKVRRLKRKEE